MLIPKKESDKIEFKPILNNAVIETLVAFSNAKGGAVYVGIADNSKVSGISLGQETLPQFINEIKSKTSPSIFPDSEIINAEKNKKVVVLSVSEYPIKPVSFQGKYYKRVNASNHLLSANEVANIHFQTINSSWDYFPHQLKTIGDISMEKVKTVMDIIKKRNANFQFDSEIEFLTKNELLLKDNRISNGCFMMFSKGHNRWSTIQMGHFASEIVIKDDVENSNDILSQIDEVMDFIRKHISKALIITDKQIENIQRWDYPLDALRELVLNMIIHRDYTAGNNSIIKIFPNSIQFFNPGVLPDSISIEQLRKNDYVSTLRNRQIAGLVKEMGLIERYGTGIKRVRRMFVDYGLKEPEFKMISGGLSVTVYVDEDLKSKKDNVTDLTQKYIYVDKKHKNTSKSRKKSVEKSVEKIIDVITSNPRITQKELAEITGLTRRRIEWKLSKLKEEGILERVGPDKGGYWKVIR